MRLCRSKVSGELDSWKPGRTSLAPVSRAMIEVVHGEAGVSRQAEVIHGQRAQRLDSFLVLWRRLAGMRRNLVDAIRDEEDQVDEKPIGGS